MAVFLMDNSVVQRLDRAPEVRGAVLELSGRGDLLATSDVSVLEAGYSARSAVDHMLIVADLSESFVRLPLNEDVGTVALALQAGLFATGRGRAVGAPDLLHAATAIVHRAVVIHYEADFELLAGVDDRLQQRWIVPPGSVD